MGKLIALYIQAIIEQGIIEGVLNAGKELEAHFPWHHNDNNELSNAVSKG